MSRPEHTEQAEQTPIWIKSPSVLFTTFDFSVHEDDANASWNSLTRAILLVVVLSLVAAATNKVFGAGIHLLPFALLLLIVMYYATFVTREMSQTKTTVTVKTTKESFVDTAYSSGLPTGFESDLPYNSGREVFTGPNAKNPFMNVLLDEIKYNPTRAPAAPISDPLVKVTFDDFFRVQWASDPTDVFGRNQSQRQFYTMPSTTIPNDQASYQNWLYLIPGKTCKEGGRAQCVPGTNGAPIPWLSQPN